MATKSLHDRIYRREYGSGNVRLWADFRDFDDVGGGQEAVKPEGVGQALLWEWEDADGKERLIKRANRWVRSRLDELEDARDHRIKTGVRRAYGLEEFAAEHLKKKARGDVSDSWLGAVETQMERAVAHFGKDRELSSIRPSDVREWVEVLRETSNGRNLFCDDCDKRGKMRDSEPVADCPECGESWRIGTLGEKTIRDHLNSLSNLYRRAQGEEAVPQGHNPVKAWLGSVEDGEKPTGGRTKEAEWLEPHEAALLLEAARTWKPEETGGAPNCSFAYPLIATVLLTGGRKSEVLGLEVSDVNLTERHVIRFEPNDHRPIKTDKSVRTVPVWPQLREILGEYLESDEGPDSGLLFPSPRTGRMIQDFRRTLDAVGGRCGFSEGEVRFHKLRHTYCAARIQTVEHGHPVSLYTVARELGHSSTRLIERRYGHLLTNRRTRGEVVEFRPETYEEEIGERLHELQVVA